MSINKQQQYSGKIISWDDEKAFGFIQLENSNKNIFFHISEYYYSGNRPKENYSVVFNIQQLDEKISAVNVRLVGSAPYTHVNVHKILRKNTTNSKNRHNNRNNSKNKGGLQQIVLWLKILLLSVLMFALYVYYPFIFIWVMALSLLNFYRYWYDKKMAINNGRRTPEAKLHFIDLLGGWVGGLLAQDCFNHKTSKKSFQLVFWLTVIINMVLIGCYILQAEQVIHIPTIDLIMDYLSLFFLQLQLLFVELKIKFNNLLLILKEYL